MKNIIKYITITIMLSLVITMLLSTMSCSRFSVLQRCSSPSCDMRDTECNDQFMEYIQCMEEI